MSHPDVVTSHFLPENPNFLMWFLLNECLAGLCLPSHPAPARAAFTVLYVYKKENHQHGRWGHLNSAFNNLQRRCWRDSACETLRSKRDSGWWTVSSLGDLKGSVFTPAHAKTAAEVIPLQVLPHFPAGWRRLLAVPDSKRGNDTRRRRNVD